MAQIKKCPRCSSKNICNAAKTSEYRYVCGYCGHVFGSKRKQDLVDKAMDFAALVHADQEDDMGKPYFEAHLFPVYQIMTHVTSDKAVLAASLLHDTIEDTEVTYTQLKKDFGVRVANLVLEVTHEGKKDSVGYWFPNLKSQEAIMIKLADRLSNISRMEAWDSKRKAQYMKNTKFWKSSPEE